MITPLRHEAMNLDVKRAKRAASRAPLLVNGIMSNAAKESAMPLVLYAIKRNYWEESKKCSKPMACFIFKVSFVQFLQHIF